MNAAALRRFAMRAGACAFAYLAVYASFRAADLGSSVVLVQPADGLGPALAFVLGLPAALGCTAAWAISEAAFGTALPLLAQGAVIELVYMLLPRLVWDAFCMLRGRMGGERLAPAEALARHRVPRLDTTGRVALYLLAAVLDALVAGGVMAFLYMEIMPDVPEKLAVSFFHSFVFLTYLGLPVVLALSRRFSASPGGPRGRTALGELMVIAFLGVIALMSVAFFILTYGVYVMDGTLSTYEDYMVLVRTFYVISTQLAPFGFLIMLLAVYSLNRRATRPIAALTRTTSTFVGRLERRDEEGGTLRVERIDERGMAPAAEVAELMNSVESMQRDLVEYVAQLESVTAERERVEAELDIARDIQASAVPHDFAAYARLGLELDGFMRPAREVGGDFYDVFALDDDRVGLVIGDVSGKGVPAALFMMRALGIIRSCMVATDDVGAALGEANDRLVERNDALLFVTVFACVLDRRSGVLAYANAGHNPPSLVRGGKRGYLRPRPGLVLGAMDGVPYVTEERQLAPGDEILLYTDGVTEAANAAEELFGEERLARVLDAFDAAATGESAEPVRMTEAVARAIDGFAGDAPQADDITLLRMRWALPTASLELTSDEDQLPRLADWVSGCVGQAARASREARGGLDRLDFNLNLICEELFVNVCHYGHPDAPEVPVRIWLAYDAGLRCMHLTMCDGGIAFNPFGHKVVMPTPDGPVGGLGVHLVRTLSDHVAYERRDDLNWLYITIPADGDKDGGRASGGHETKEELS